MTVCKGKNCTAVNGKGHSDECIKEYDAITNIGEFNTPGNRHPECRYRGYKGEPLSDGATDDQKVAWEEGSSARL